MVQDELGIDEETGGPSVAPIIAAAIAAGIAAYLIRRSRQAEEARRQPASIAAAAWSRVQDPTARLRAADATREWIAERMVPELKPVLLDLLKGVKDLVDQGFKKAEKAIRDL
ncbi:MAG TPA: hypothetical protein VFC51_19075 [Chloroflexota bacterium]|nr:hypothetical protein [Chloroflexota bacterium]